MLHILLPTLPRPCRTPGACCHSPRPPSRVPTPNSRLPAHPHLPSPPRPLPQLHPKHVTRSVRAEGNNLVVAFAATDLRMLRGAASTFSDLLALATRTQETFDLTTGTHAAKAQPH